jgi:hypothetical protein
MRAAQRDEAELSLSRETQEREARIWSMSAPAFACRVSQLWSAVPGTRLLESPPPLREEEEQQG